MTSEQTHDVVIVGGGHNGLVAATLLARAGLSVLVLERLDHTGGAAVSAQAFRGHPARLSRYSYLVSLMPEQLMADLGLDVALEALREYLRSRTGSVDELMRAARVCRVARVMQPYLEAMV